jgi:hypothetical protein
MTLPRMDPSLHGGDAAVAPPSAGVTSLPMSEDSKTATGLIVQESPPLCPSPTRKPRDVTSGRRLKTWVRSRAISPTFWLGSPPCPVGLANS